jgi:formamidopyrimidine-DNA glycosylase
MPELPEVEHLRAVTDHTLRGKHLRRVLVDTEDRKVLIQQTSAGAKNGSCEHTAVDPARWGALLEGAIVLGTGRHGKWMWIDVMAVAAADQATQRTTSPYFANNKAPAPGDKAVKASTPSNHSRAYRLYMHMGMTGAVVTKNATSPNHVQSHAFRGQNADKREQLKAIPAGDEEAVSLRKRKLTAEETKQDAQKRGKRAVAEAEDELASGPVQDKEDENAWPPRFWKFYMDAVDSSGAEVSLSFIDPRRYINLKR